jgi:hypothetical protein
MISYHNTSVNPISPSAVKLWETINPFTSSINSKRTAKHTNKQTNKQHTHEYDKIFGHLNGE